MELCGRGSDTHFMSGQNIPTNWNYVTEAQTHIYFISSQNIPTKQNYVTEIQLRIYFRSGHSEAVKIFQLSGIM